MIRIHESEILEIENRLSDLKSEILEIDNKLSYLKIEYSINKDSLYIGKIVNTNMGASTILGFEKTGNKCFLMRTIDGRFIGGSFPVIKDNFISWDWGHYFEYDKESGYSWFDKKKGGN